jgi:TrmH family RNA methyltransferase
MKSKLITSHDNPEIKHLKNLSLDSDYRYENGQYLIEGVRSLDDNKSILRIYLREGTSLPMKTTAPVTLLAANLFDKISLTKNSQGMIAVSKLKVYDKSSIDHTMRYVLLDRLQDPGNMGTIIRTACAFDFAGVIIAKGSVDPFSPKVVRASMSGVDKIKIILIESYKELNGKYLIAADKTGVPVNKFCWPDSFIIVIGNEANGVSDELLGACEHKLSIPLHGRIESLNAAVAAGIVLFESQK